MQMIHTSKQRPGRKKIKLQTGILLRFLSTQAHLIQQTFEMLASQLVNKHVAMYLMKQFKLPLGIPLDAMVVSEHNLNL